MKACRYYPLHCVVYLVLSLSLTIVLCLQIDQRRTTSTKLPQYNVDREEVLLVRLVLLGILSMFLFFHSHQQQLIIGNPNISATMQQPSSVEHANYKTYNL